MLKGFFPGLMVLAVFLAIVGPGIRVDPAVSATVAPPCGTPAWTASPGAPLNAANINSELNHLESCAASALYSVAPGGAGTPAAGSCIAITTPPADGTVTNICTPYPTPTATCANPNCTAAGLTITVITPTPVASSALVSANTLETILAARTDILHWWTLHGPTSLGGSTPGPCSTSVGAFVDTPATALASPVPLVVATIAGLPPPTCAMPDILPNNRSTSVGFCWGVPQQGCNAAVSGGSSYLLIPAVAQTACFATTPYTIFAVVNPIVTSRQQAFYERDPQDNLVLEVNANQQWDTTINAGAHNVMYATGPAFFVYTNDGTTSSTYINGSPITEPTIVPLAAPTGNGAIGHDFGNGTRGFMGRVENVGCANTAWSLGLIQYLYSLSGL